MWGHGHHRKGRLSLPSIRISTAPDFNKSHDSNSAPVDRALSSSHPTTGAHRPISQDFQNGTTSSSLRNHQGNRTGSQNASVSSSSVQGSSVRSRQESAAQHTQLLPPFKERPLTESEQEIEHSILFRSLRGDYRPREDEDPPLDQHTAASDPFMPPELIAAIQTSMKNCSEYERQCAQLEHSVEHKILMFSHILEQYEGQDHRAVELREMISTAQATLQHADPTMHLAETTAGTAYEKLDEYEKTLRTAKEIAEKSKETMLALDKHMTDQEAIQEKIETWQNALLGTATGLVVLIAILLAWLFS